MCVIVVNTLVFLRIVVKDWKTVEYRSDFSDCVKYCKDEE